MRFMKELGQSHTLQKTIETASAAAKAAAGFRPV